jgi:hypothetical protein
MHIIGAGSWLTIVFLRIELSFRLALEIINSPLPAKTPGSGLLCGRSQRPKFKTNN